MRINKRVAVTIAVGVLGVSALTGCGINDNSDTTEPTPTNTTTEWNGDCVEESIDPSPESTESSDMAPMAYTKPSSGGSSTGGTTGGSTGGSTGGTTGGSTGGTTGGTTGGSTGGTTTGTKGGTTSGKKDSPKGEKKTKKPHSGGGHGGRHHDDYDGPCDED